MKQKVNPMEYAQVFTEALPKGVFLNTYHTKFNSMVIGWGAIGIEWGMKTVTVYVRQSRYSKPQIDATGEFTVSIPYLCDPDKELIRVMGRQSGRDIDKAEYVTLIDPEENHVPGFKEAPLTLECKVLYHNDQLIEDLPEKVTARNYTKGSDANDYHTAYIAEIVAAYIIQ